MKSKQLARLGAVAVALSLATTSLMSGTLARYTTTVSGEDTVTVARFGYEANDGEDDVEFTTDGYAEIDLFDNLTTEAEGTIATDGDEVDDSDDLKFAPGAYGSFDIELNGFIFRC